MRAFLTTHVEVSPNTHFINAMNEMRAHYKANPGTPFRLMNSRHVQALLASGPRPRIANDDSGVPAILTDVASTAKSAQQSSNDAQQQGATDATNALQSDQDADSFTAKMNAQRAKAKADSAKLIDDAYDKATALGIQHPEQQNAIVAGMDFISSTLTNVVQGVVDFLENLAGKVFDIIKGVLGAPLDFIEKGFSAVGGLLGAL